MINQTQTIHPALEILLALTLGAAASIWTWNLTADGAAGTSTIMYACFMHRPQSDGGSDSDPVNSNR
jgi:hypothetical protein